MSSLNRDAEAARILSHFGESFADIMAMLERQFHVLHNRAQVLLALCGIVVSTTGFSGRLVAGTNFVAQICVIAGVALVMIAAALVAWGVLHLRWLTMQLGDDVRQWLLTSLEYRDLKTNYYRAAVWFMLAGLLVYGVAIAIMLLNPHADVLPPR
jgi:hypothetical protein